MRRLFGLTMISFLLGSCTRPVAPFSIRYAGGKSLRRPGSAADMDCFFVSLTPTKSSAPEVPSCTGLGSLSTLMTLDDISSRGATLRVSMATQVNIRVYGLGTPGACLNLTRPESLFTASFRPEIYEVGSAEASFFGNSSVLVPNTYDTNSPNIAACDLTFGATTVLSIAPTEGLHRGGLTATIRGTGFAAGATASLGGVPCTNTTVTNESTLTCLTPDIPAQKADVSVRNPRSTAGTLTAGFEAFQVVYAAMEIDSQSKVLAYRQSLESDSNSGYLNAISGSASTATAQISNISLHPSGRWVITASSTGSHYTPWRVNLATGALTKENDIATAVTTQPRQAVFHPGGRYLYVVLSSSRSVIVCDFNETTAACNSRPVQGEGLPGAPAEGGILKTGKFFFVRITTTTPGLYRIPIGANGSLSTGTLVEPFTSLLANLDFVVFHPFLENLVYHDGDFANEELLLRNVDVIGNLTPVSRTFRLSGGLLNEIAMTASGNYVYELKTNGVGVSVFPVDGSGFPLNTPADRTLIYGGSKMAVDSRGEHMFILNNATAYTIQTYNNVAGLPPGTPSQAIALGVSTVAAAGIVVN